MGEIRIPHLTNLLKANILDRQTDPGVPILPGLRPIMLQCGRAEEISD